MQLILASTSRYRAGLLERLGLPFTTQAPEVDETPLAGESPEQLVGRLSRLKAEAVSSNHPDALVIGSDQVAVIGTDILGKPGTIERAEHQLAMLSGNQVTFLTGLCVVNTATASLRQALVETPVWFRSLSARQIADYVAREQPLDCAGAFKSEGLGIALFERLGGTDPNALIGLPLIELCSMLEAENHPVLGLQTD